MSDCTTVLDKGRDQPTLRKRFTVEEDKRLKNLVQRRGYKIWEEIAQEMPNRTARQCRDRYNNYLFKEITKSPWTEEEDAFIVMKYNEIGPHWVKIAKHLNGRSGNNVKNRWHKTLSKKFTSEKHTITKDVREKKQEPVKQESKEDFNFDESFFDCPCDFV